MPATRIATVAWITSAAALFLVGDRLAAQRRGRNPVDAPVSPLTAAVWTGNGSRVPALLDAGEDPSGPEEAGAPPWVWAAAADDAPSLKAMLARIKDIQPEKRRTATTLPMAAVRNDLFLVDALLRRGVDVDFRVVDRSTALVLASASGYADIVELLLDWGAEIDAQDQFGDTALMSAVRAGSLPVVRGLLARGAAVTLHDAAGRSAMTWALRSRRGDITSVLKQSGAADEPPPPPARPAATPRAAAERSLPLLQAAAQSWLERQQCASCHHQPMIERATAVARSHGLAVNESFVRAQRERVHGKDDARAARFAEILRTDAGVLQQSIQTSGDPAFGNGWFDAGDLAAGAPASPSSRVEATFLARVQLVDGSWQTGAPRVPIESSRFKSTADAIRVLQAFAPADQRADTDARVDRARSWLRTHAPATADDFAFRLFGLRWAGAAPEEIAHATEDLRREQQPDGGWPQLRGLNSDAYATGMALVALHEAGNVPGTDVRYRRGVDYLLSTQEADGSWLVHKRAYPMNGYFESGFPHGKFQFISFAGSCWATMALLYSADEH